MYHHPAASKEECCGICVADAACTVAVFEDGDPEGGTCHVKAESKAGYAKRGYWACRARPKAAEL